MTSAALTHLLLGMLCLQADAKAFRAFGRSQADGQDDHLPHDSIYRLSATDIDGQVQKLSKYAGALLYKG